MRKVCQLSLCCFVILASSSHWSVSVRGSDDLAITANTVAGRRERVAQLLTERSQPGLDGVALVQKSNELARLYLKLCEFDSALTESQTALTTARTLGSTDEKLLVDTLALAARVHIDRTESATALPLASEALERSQKLSYRYGEATSHLRLSEAYFELDKRDEAEASNDRALEIWQELQEKRGEAMSRVMQGDLLMMHDRDAEAADSFKRAEALSREIGDPIQLATSLVDHNFLAIRQGQWQDALVLLDEARTLLVEKNAEAYLAAKIANSFGEIYEAYGQLDTALSYYRESLWYFRDIGHDVKGSVTAGIKLARVLASSKDVEAAKQQMQESLAVAIGTNNALTIGRCHQDFGTVFLKSGAYDQARLEFLAAISYFTTSKSERPLALVYMYLGQTEHLLGDLAGAGRAYETALRFFTKTLDYPNEAALRFGMGKLALEQGSLDKAEENLKRSIELTENLRENASSKDLRSSFLDSVHDRYETYVEWLMTRYTRDHNQQYAVDAFEAAERGRARALLDSLSGYQRELRQPSDPSLLFDEAELQKKEQQLIDARDSLLSAGGTAKDRTDVEQKLRDVRAQIETVAARINSSAKFNDLLRSAPLTYDRIRTELTNSETSLVSYSLGTGKSFAWVVTKDGLATFQLPDKKTIENVAGDLLDRLKRPPANEAEQTQLQAAIDNLSRLVVEPLSSRLQTSRLIVVADGILQYVPFQVLKTSAAGSEAMISRFDIVDAPSASALAIVQRERLRRQPAAKLLVGFGDAVFSADYGPQPAKNQIDSGAARSKETSRFRDLPPLFNAQRELRAIGQLAGNDSTFYTEYDATRAKLLSVDLSQFRILHVVTHGVLDDQQPELSGLVLSMVDGNARPIDGFVSLADIYKLRAPVDLVVLSACHTALGSNLRGEGLIGVTRGFMYAGASGVVASLWKVDDRATAELMKYFYSNMLQRGMGPAAALRAAQNEIRSQPKWSAPYYWAGFTFQGDYGLTIRSEQNRFAYGRWIAIVALVCLAGALAYWLFQRRRRKQTHLIATRQ